MRITEYADGIVTQETKLVGFELDGAMGNYLARDVADEFEGQLIRAEVEFSSAEILAESIKDLIAAPGEDKIIVIHRAYCIYTYGTITYTGTTALLTLFVTGPISLATCNLASPITQGVSYYANGAVETGALPLASINDQKIEGQIANDLITGDGTVSVVIYYTIEDV